MEDAKEVPFKLSPTAVFAVIMAATVVMAVLATQWFYLSVVVPKSLAAMVRAMPQSHGHDLEPSRTTEPNPLADRARMAHEVTARVAKALEDNASIPEAKHLEVRHGIRDRHHRCRPVRHPAGKHEKSPVRV